MDDGTGEHLLLTYVELGERFGITPDSARLKAKRKASRGEWQVVPPNREGGPSRVRVPLGDLPEHPPERSPEHPEQRTPSADTSSGEMLAQLAELRASIAELHGVHARAVRASEEAAELRLALAKAEMTAASVATIAKGEVEAAKRVAAAEVEGTKASTAIELAALRQQIETEVTARNTVIEELRAELARLRLPFWRRWLGRP
jgi:hypothetical protein